MRVATRPVRSPCRRGCRWGIAPDGTDRESGESKVSATALPPVTLSPAG
jgi:hypothetical protein